MLRVSTVLRERTSHPVQDPSTPNTEVPVGPWPQNSLVPEPQTSSASLPLLPHPNLPGHSATPLCHLLNLPTSPHPGSKETVHTQCIFPHIALVSAFSTCAKLPLR